MNPLVIASSISSDTKIMTVNYDGCTIRLQPMVVGIDVLVNRRIDFRIFINDKIVKEARYEMLCEFTFQGKSNIHTIEFKQTVSQPKQTDFPSKEPEKPDFDYSKILFTINHIPVRHTSKDPMEKLTRALLGLKFSLSFNMLILIIFLFQEHFIDAFLYSFFASMTFMAILSFRRYHLTGLILGTSICMIEILLYTFGVFMNEEYTSSLLVTILIALKLRVVILYYISTGIASAWKLLKHNKRLHAELDTKSFL